MPIGYDYRCQRCAHEWTLFTKRFTLGPVQWGETKYTCLSCQTFLSVPVSVDFNSWRKWIANHKEDVQRNSVIAELAQSIENRLPAKRSLAPIKLDFTTIQCPTCGDPMSTTSFGEHLMKCPKCELYAGNFEGGDGISIYDFPDAEDRTEHTDELEPQ